MKKCIAILLCLLALALPSFAAGSASAPDAVIKTLDAQYTLHRDGACTVVMTATASFSGNQTHFDFPLPESARDVSVGGLSHTARRENGALVLSLQLPAAAAEQTFTVSCRLPETASGSHTGQSCTLRLLMPGRACAIESFTATVTMPRAFDELPSFESGYYGELIENYMDLSVKDGVITLQSKQPLRDHESLKMKLDLPASYFDLRFLAGKTAAVDTVLFWLLLLAAGVYWLLFLRNPLILPATQAMPPLSGNAGAVPYLLTGDTPDLALMVMHWASLGYLTIARTRKGKLYLKRQMDMGSERKPYEVRVFRSLFDRTDLCSAHSDDFRRVREEAPTVVKGALDRRLFAPKGGKPLILRLLGAACAAVLCLQALDAIVAAQAWRWFVIVPLALLGGLAGWLLQALPVCFLRRRTARTAALAALSFVYLFILGHRAGMGLLLIACILLQLLIGAGLFLGGKRTRQGVRLATELLGLYRYYRTVTPAALQELLQEDPQYYYRALPYADALRCADRLTKKLEGVRLEPCTWLTSETAKPHTAAGFRRLYARVLNELREQTDGPLANLIANLRRR